jgi:hypothetical protein
MPPPNIRDSITLNQMCFLSCHNAYAAEQYGYIYANQYYSIKEQLERGVRSFELDIEKRSWKHQYPFWGPAGSTISLCHSSYLINCLIQPNPVGLIDKAIGPTSLLDILKLYLAFLTQFPDQLIVITFEDRVTLQYGATYEDLDAVFVAAGIDSMTLKPTDWDPVANKGWPTIGWLLQNNKRFICVSDQSSAEVGYTTTLPYASSFYTYYQWFNFAQNQSGYGKDIGTALEERSASQTYNQNIKYILELDWYDQGGMIFGGCISDIINIAGNIIHKQTPFGWDYEDLNGPKLQNFIATAFKEGLTTNVGGQKAIIGQNRRPNIVKVDYFNKGTIGLDINFTITLVNAINTESYNVDPPTRARLFAPLSPTILI